MPSAWFRRNVCHSWDGDLLDQFMCLATVDRSDRTKSPDRGGTLEGLCYLPRPARLIFLCLPIAACHIKGKGNQELDLVMNVGRVLRIGKLPGGIQTVGVLLENEPQFPIGIVAHLNCVSSIVSTDTINPAKRKKAAAIDRNGKGGWSGDHKSRHVSPRVDELLIGRNRLAT